MTLSDRIHEHELIEGPCDAIHAPTGLRCERSDPHTADDIHTRGALRWGSRNLPPRPRWMDNLEAREFTETRL